MTHGKDHVTYDVIKDILREEIEHEAWFLELLHGRPSGHMRRKYPTGDRILRNTQELWVKSNI